MYHPETELCTGDHWHDEAICRVSGWMPPEEELAEMAELFKVFGDSTRIRILYLLSESELCVCDIAGLLDVTQSAVSHQLRVLKAGKLVKFRREGKTVFYSLADQHVVRILSHGMEHVAE